MKIILYKITLLLIFINLFSCQKTTKSGHVKALMDENFIMYSKGLQIEKYQGFSKVIVSNPWPQANKKFTYILKEKNAKIPDSLLKYTAISVPVKSIVVTSTTNIPFLEMLGVENKLVGFPHTDYVSSLKTRKLIDAGYVKNVGQNEMLNTEKLIDLLPDVIIAFGVDNSNPLISNLEKSGLKVLIQADWMEQTPLGKAEWIKLYGALFKKEKEAEKLFNSIVVNYNNSKKLVDSENSKSSVLYGSMYQDKWYLAKGNSWVAQFIKDAKAHYLWDNVSGSGSLILSFEKVLEKAKNAKYWIVTGSPKNSEELRKSSPHYAQFDAMKTKELYTFEGKLGPTGGIIYYELSPSRPDLVLKDYIKIFHPELLPNYTFTFAEKLN